MTGRTPTVADQRRMTRASCPGNRRFVRRLGFAALATESTVVLALLIASTVVLWLAATYVEPTASTPAPCSPSH